MSMTASLAIEWQAPDTWHLAPSDLTQRADWPMSLADGRPADHTLRTALGAAHTVSPVDPALLPFVVLAETEPWIDGSGWLSAWRTAPDTRARIESFFASESASRTPAQSVEIYDVDSDNGQSKCLMLHSLEVAGPGDDGLVERISAFRIDAQTGVTLQLCVVTRNLLAFDDLPALAAEILNRSGPASGAAHEDR